MKAWEAKISTGSNVLFEMLRMAREIPKSSLSGTEIRRKTSFLGNFPKCGEANSEDRVVGTLMHPTRSIIHTALGVFFPRISFKND
jgi:hypothetical protein